jgi:transglutaminase-like putative cysteine protease
MVALSMLVASGVQSALGQSPGPGASGTPERNAGGFQIPPPDALASLAAAQVSDQPADLPDTIDLWPAIATGLQHYDALSSEQWEVADLASTLPDTTSAFDLVRDSIAFDAYPGMLRGAEGTLTARAGNSIDRALLLQELLNDQGDTTRLAFGQLSPDAAAALVARSLDEVPRPLQAAGFSPFSPGFRPAVEARAGRDYALLTAALGDRLANVDADGTSAAIADATSHAWVQVQQPDGTWLDLDPSMPDSQPGQTLTSADSTADALPDDARETVTLRVIAETLEDGSLSESPILSATLDPSIASDQQILVAFGPAGADGGLLGGPGGLLGSGGQGDATYVPVMTIDGTTWTGDPVSVSSTTDGGGLLGGGGDPQDLASLSLEIETDAPGADPQIARHVIVDRVPAADRDGRSLNSDDLLPVPNTDGPPAMFATVLHVMLSTGGSNPRTYASQQALAAETVAVDANAPAMPDAGLAIDYAPAAVADEALVIASEQQEIPAINDTEVRAFVARPRVYISAWSQDTNDPSMSEAQIDLMIDGIRTLPRTDAPADAAARHQLWYGALQGAVESEQTLESAATFDPQTVTISGVSFDMDRPLTVLTGDDAADLPPTAAPGLAAALEAGSIVVVPGDRSVAKTWWQVAPDGTTRSILAPTLGGSGVGGVARPAAFKVPKVNGIDWVRMQARRFTLWIQGKGDEESEVETEVANETEEVADAVGYQIKDTFEEADPARLANLEKLLPK